MSKLIDALVLEIQLQRKDFDKGLKEIQDGYKKAADALVQSNKEIAGETKKAADSLSGLTREAQSFLAILAGAAAGRALASFSSGLGAMDAALARFSANVGANPQDISAWGQAVERVGGSAQVAQSTIQGLYDKVWRLTELGESPTPGFWLGLGKGGVSKEFFKQQDAYDRILVVAKAIQNINAKSGRAEAAAAGRNFFGLDEGTINLILEKGPKLKESLADIKRKTTPTTEDTEAAKRLQEAWFSLSQTIDDFARKLKTAAEPYIQAFMDGFIEFVQSWDKASIKAKIKEFGDFLLGEGGQDIKRFFLDLKSIVTGVADRINAVGEAYSAVRDSRFGRAVGASVSGLGYAGRTLGGIAAGAYNFGARQLGYGGSESSPAASSGGASTSPQSNSSPASTTAQPSASSGAPTAASAMMTYAMDQLRKEGVAEANVRAAAAHLVGQATMESGLNPNLSHDGGTGYGIYGARLGRRAGMLKWLKDNGYAANSAEGQMRSMAHEAMTGGYGVTRSTLLNAKPDTLARDSWGVTRNFESPAVTNDRSRATIDAYNAYRAPLVDPKAMSFFDHSGWRNSAWGPHSSYRSSSYENTTRTNTSTTIGAMNFNTGGTGANQFPKDVPAYFANYNYAVIHNDGAR